MTAPKPKETTPFSLHKAINWVVSIILLIFAIWSIQMNTQGQSFFKQANQLYSETDKKITDIGAKLDSVKDACLSTPVVIPTTPITTTTTTTK